MKYKVLVTRVVRYSTEVQVNADTIGDARDKAVQITQNGHKQWEEISDDHFPIAAVER